MEWGCVLRKEKPNSNDGTLPEELKLDGFGPSLRSLRDHIGEDGAELAEKLGIDASTLSKYERGKRAVPFRLVVQLAAIIGESPIALLVWCMRDRFPELGDSSNEMSAFLADALAHLEKKLA